MTAPTPSAADRPRSTTRRRRHGRLLALLAAVATIVVACGGSSAILSSVGDDVGAERAAPMPAEVPAAGDVAAEDVARLLGDGTDRAATDAGGPLIVRTGRLDLEVDDLDAALAAAAAAVSSAGGYVAASQREGDEERAMATVTYRIPATSWDATLAALRAVGDTVLAEQTASEEVTSQVVDLAARLANLRATEAALQAIMAKATRIPDVLEVQAQLSAVREEIERLTAQKAALEERAALATLTVGFSLPPVVAVTQVREGWDPAAEVDRAMATLVGLGQWLAGAAIWVGIVVLPLALVLAVGVAIAWALARRLRPRHGGGPGPAATTDAPAA